MTTDSKATFFANFPRVMTFFLAVCLLLFEITADPIPDATLFVVTVFMLLWSITDWNVIEVEP